jgi:HPt (histidine-containing phosphotransfer) domain-containing protein
MSTPAPDFEAFLDQQRAAYRRALPEKMRQAHALWLASEMAAQALSDLERLAHTLAGTAGTLGFQAVGLAAKALELRLQQAREAGPDLAAAQRPEIALAVAALQASLPHDDFSPHPEP